ncbi:uncharacterized protein LOC119459332 [Dermacentor silvarum]|uniref:uncharacterized protein LOC119459332 n=1 Tax=Dermacentor silvarum TaxID=543639 RepID=UPI001899A059|nr:uncharacterized protein LOC119459332 [Dermacentor silvarum]
MEPTAADRQRDEAGCLEDSVVTSAADSDDATHGSATKTEVTTVLAADASCSVTPHADTSASRQQSRVSIADSVAAPASPTTDSSSDPCLLCCTLSVINATEPTIRVSSTDTISATASEPPSPARSSSSRTRRGQTPPVDRPSKPRSTAQDTQR